MSALPSPAAAWALVAAGFRRYQTYRRAAVAGVFTNTVFGVIRVSILFAAADAAGGTVAGYDRAALSTYTWLSQGMIAVVWMYAWTTVTDRVRSGDVAIDLARPVHPVAAWLAEDLGRAGQACLVRFTGPLLVGGLLFGLRVPTRPETVPLFVLAVVLAVLISFGGRLLVSLSAFWLVDARGVVSLYALTVTALSGLVVPLHFLPDWARVVAYATPFPWIMQGPLDVGTERYTGAGALGVLGVQLLWAAGLLAVGTWVFGRGAGRLVVQGG